MPKKPFSGKQKKLQLQAKKNRHQQQDDDDDDPRETRRGNVERSKILASTSKGFTDNTPSSKFFDRRPAPTRMDAGRYALIFRAESREEVLRQKEEARNTIHPVLEEYLECKSEDFYTSELDFPVRPPWSYKISREEIDRNENRYFHEYLRNIDLKFERSELSYFELNLETWRQFWRVLEMSDILLCIVDIRYPPLLFPPKLYEYVCKELGKQLILVLNKIDLCPAPLVLAWKDYFKEKYPELEILCFTSFPSYNLHGNASAKGIHKNQKVRGRLRMAAEGAMELYNVAEKIVAGQVDLSKWKQKIMEEMHSTEEDDEEDVKIESIYSDKQETGFYEFKKFSDGKLTIGCVGQPNVGKSSLINALMGKKVVSVSRTPGHTKHFQTIFLTPNVRLCDCPGLIFPSRVPKPLQVLCGSYPIAQLREPYSTVKYLGQRLDLPRILGITHPEGDTEWCAFDIADGWAKKRGYVTAKAARLDSYRGANHILRFALEGRICLCLRPPGYSKNIDTWGKDPRVAEINRIQAKSGDTDVNEKPFVHPLQRLDEADDDEEHDEPEYEERDDSGDDADTSSEDRDETESDSGEEPSEKSPQIGFQSKFALLGDDDA